MERQRHALRDRLDAKEERGRLGIEPELSQKELSIIHIILSVTILLYCIKHDKMLYYLAYILLYNLFVLSLHCLRVSSLWRSDSPPRRGGGTGGVGSFTSPRRLRRRCEVAAREATWSLEEPRASFMSPRQRFLGHVLKIYVHIPYIIPASYISSIE